MPYTKEHKQRTSIEQIMTDSQLTRGAFYAHFLSKADLYREAMAPPASAVTPIDYEAPDWRRDLLGAASRTGPWSFLAIDIGSGASEARAAYAQRLRALCRRVEKQLGTGRRSEDAALSAVATFVGMLAISATVDDAQLQKTLFTACSDCLDRKYTHGLVARSWNGLCR